MYTAYLSEKMTETVTYALLQNGNKREKLGSEALQLLSKSAPETFYDESRAFAFRTNYFNLSMVKELYYLRIFLRN